MKISASYLRANIYQILDRVKDKGVPVEINRKGTILKIATTSPISKLKNLKKRKNIYNGSIDDLIYLDWVKYWKP